MHPPLEQAWELARVGKDVYDFEDEYRAAQKPQKDYVAVTNGNLTKFFFPPTGPSRPPPDPEMLKRVLDEERAAEAARRNAPHLRKLNQVCSKADEG